MFYTPIFVDDSMRCGDNRSFPCNIFDAHIGDPEISQHQLFQNTGFLIVPTGDLCNRFRGRRFFLHQKCQLFKKPLIRIFCLRQIPVIRRYQIKLVIRGSIAQSCLLVDILSKFIYPVISGKNQCLTSIGPMIKIFGINLLFIKRKAIGITHSMINEYDFEGSRLRISSKRLPW